MIWEVQASASPPFEVYQLQHGDVLITEVPKKSAKPGGSMDIQGSAKTIAALQTPSKQANVDPWLNDDPWGSYATPAKVAKTAPEVLRPSQIDNIAMQVADL